LLACIDKFFGHLRVFFGSFLAGNAASQSKLSANYRTLVKPESDAVKVSDELFTVAFQSSNQAFHPQATAFASQASALDYVAKTVAAQPSLAGQLHVLPNFEVAV